MREVNWKVVADSLRLLGAWTMVGTCGLARTMDAGELNIVRLDGDVLSRYSCNAPSNKGGTEAGRAAKALYEYFSGLVRRAHSSCETVLPTHVSSPTRRTNTGYRGSLLMASSRGCTRSRINPDAFSVTAISSQ